MNHFGLWGNFVEPSWRCGEKEPDQIWDGNGLVHQFEAHPFFEIFWSIFRYIYYWFWFRNPWDGSWSHLPVVFFSDEVRQETFCFHLRSQFGHNSTQSVIGMVQDGKTLHIDQNAKPKQLKWIKKRWVSILTLKLSLCLWNTLRICFLVAVARRLWCLGTYRKGLYWNTGDASFFLCTFRLAKKNGWWWFQCQERCEAIALSLGFQRVFQVKLVHDSCWLVLEK